MPVQLIYGLLILGALAYAEKRRRTIRPGIPAGTRAPLEVTQTYP